MNEFDLLIATQSVPGLTPLHKFGLNIDIDTGTVPEHIWTPGGLWVPPTQARKHNIASSSANDTLLGSGLRTIQIWGLDSNWMDASEVIEMDGTNDVETALEYVSIFRMKGLTCGTGKYAAGTIQAMAQTDATVTAEIMVGYGQTLMAIYTVPADKYLVLSNYYCDINRPGVAAGLMANGMLEIMENADQADSPWLVKQTFGAAVDGQNKSKDYGPGYLINPKTHVTIKVDYVSDSNTRVSAGFDGVLVDYNMTWVQELKAVF